MTPRQEHNNSTFWHLVTTWAFQQGTSTVFLIAICAALWIGTPQALLAIRDYLDKHTANLEKNQTERVRMVAEAFTKDQERDAEQSKRDREMIDLLMKYYESEQKKGLRQELEPTPDK